MRKAVFTCIVAMLVAASAAAADITPTEARWLKGAWPVIAFAGQARLPLDIVVQPQSPPGAVPLALAFVEGRCKLVLSMRGNPEAQATLERIAPDLVDATIELMTAHELGHCWRYAKGAWYDVPVGFVPAVPLELEGELRSAYVGMTAQRREEGFGDLVGLAWVRQRRPADYERLYAWLAAERTHERVRGSPHDTLVWVHLAEKGVAVVDGSIFKGAAALWVRGLSADADANE